jgi:hypothetical protein
MAQALFGETVGEQLHRPYRLSAAVQQYRSETSRGLLADVRTIFFAV